MLKSDTEYLDRVLDLISVEFGQSFQNNLYLYRRPESYQNLFMHVTEYEKTG